MYTAAYTVASFVIQFHNPLTFQHSLKDHVEVKVP